MSNYNFRKEPPLQDGASMIVYAAIREALTPGQFEKLQDRYFKYRDYRHSVGKDMLPFYKWIIQNVTITPTNYDPVYQREVVDEQ